MVFYDQSGIRKQVVWLALAFLFLLIGGAITLGSVHLFKAEAFAPTPHTQPSADDPRFKKTIALTFDDGPHPIYTPELMQVLKENGVPATFFLLGQNVAEHPHLAAQVVDAGFEIGNHTFTHSESVHITEQRLRRELVAADRVIRDATGVSPILYRPPYLLDIYAGQFDGSQVDEQALRWAEAAGYITVGTTIDSRDWEYHSRAQAPLMLAAVEAELKDGANVILFHDDGGSGATIDMLREFIPRAKALGYTFVDTSFYFDLPRAEAMRPADGVFSLDQLALVSVAKVLVFGTTTLGTIVGVVSAIVIARMLVMIAIRKTYVPLARRRDSSTHREPVSILVPAYNEAANIEATVRSVFAAMHPGDELIVIDDGSKDNTAEIVRSLIKPENPSLVLLQKENGGTKSGALTYGLKYASHDIVVCIDGDTVVASTSFGRLVRHFEDPKVGAVAGKIYPASTASTLAALQYLEYIQGQNLDKEVMAMWNGVGVVPGAIGAWRKSVIESLGGFSHETVVEDQDLTLALLASGYRIAYEPRAIAYTETPPSVRAFFRQRSRWIYGTLQCVWKYRAHLFSLKRPSLGFLILPNVILFNLLLPMMVPIIDAGLIAGLLGFEEMWRMLVFFLFFMLFDLWYSIEAMAFESQPKYQLIPLIVFQRWFYRYIMAFAIIKSLITALAGTLVRWGVQQRSGDCHTIIDSIVAQPSPVIASQSLPTPPLSPPTAQSAA